MMGVLNTYGNSHKMILVIAACMFSAYIGYRLHDRYIREAINRACLSALDDDTFLVGGSLDHIKCLNILNEDELHRVFSRISP